MGLKTGSSRVYVDSNIIIYLLEGFSGLESALQLLRRAIRQRTVVAITSELAISEVQVLPYKRQDVQAVLDYRRFLEDSSAFELVPISRDILSKAALYRATLGLKFADAIHVASATESVCAYFLTNDRDIRTPRTLTITRLEDFTGTN